jgi:hypothetical protein
MTMFDSINNENHTSWNDQDCSFTLSFNLDDETDRSLSVYCSGNETSIYFPSPKDEFEQGVYKYEYIQNGTTDTYYTNGTVSRYEYVYINPGFNQNVSYYSDDDCKYAEYFYYKEAWCNNGSYFYFPFINLTTEDLQNFVEPIAISYEYYTNGSYSVLYSNGTVEY